MSHHVKLTVPLLVGDTHRNPGEVVEVGEARAAKLIGLGHAILATPSEIAGQAPQKPEGLEAIETADARPPIRKAARLVGRVRG